MFLFCPCDAGQKNGIFKGNIYDSRIYILFSCNMYINIFFIILIVYLSSHYCCTFFVTAYLFTYVFILISIYEFKEMHYAITYITRIDFLNSSTSKTKRGEKWKTTCRITCTRKGTSDVNALCRLQTDTATIAKIRGRTQARDGKGQGSARSS